MLETLNSLFPYVFCGTVMCLAVAELVLPERGQRQPVNRRWFTNIGLFLIGLVVQRLLLPISALVVSETAVQSGHGLLQLLGGPVWAVVLAGVLLLDLWKYLEHRLVHGVSIFWRLHAVHHSDTDADFTTTERHHPLELVFGAILLFAVISLIGVPPLAVAIYLLLAPAVAFFSHANIRLPDRLDRGLRWVIVTPAMHTVHHSAVRRETDSNFGVLLTFWDRIFNTYRTSTPAQDAARVIGLEYFRDARSARLDRVLWMPFLRFEAYREAVRADAENDTPVAL